MPISVIVIAIYEGSKDNISAVVVPLPGAVYGDPSRGGVDARREQRMKLREMRNQQEHA